MGFRSQIPERIPDSNASCRGCRGHLPPPLSRLLDSCRRVAVAAAETVVDHEIAFELFVSSIRFTLIVATRADKA